MNKNVLILKLQNHITTIFLRIFIYDAISKLYNGRIDIIKKYNHVVFTS